MRLADFECVCKWKIVVVCEGRFRHKLHDKNLRGSLIWESIPKTHYFYKNELTESLNDLEPFEGIRSTGSKAERAGPVSSQSEAGNVRLVRGVWIGDFLDELEGFPEGSHDDQVDAFSGAYNQLVAGGEPRLRRLG